MPSSAVVETDPFETLNAEQRQAVEHGLGGGSEDTRPLLIIAGARSGKTNILAYRVANLILHRADPQRMLLLTAVASFPMRWPSNSTR
jgi:DNA helicase-2/ATP-dependent DNA helicase PcrA